jgi:hypothetical protein
MANIAPTLASLLLASVVFAGCVGRTSSAGSGDGGGGGGSGSGSGGGSCVDIDLSSYDVSCKADTDCIEITSGQVCSGSCTCGGSSVNASEQARYQAQLSSLQLGQCACPEEPQPQCLGNVCTICRGAPSDPPACGTTTVDAGLDGPACVNVDLSTYDQSCQTSSDCADITSGEICAGSCECGGSAINNSGLARYQATIAALGTSSECPCPADGALACIQNKCTICGFGPNQPQGCPDGF